jgi:hypothetical protein
MTYFNTTNEAGQLLINYTEKANTQKETVHTFFKAHPTGLYTTVEVQEATGRKCHASVKRAVSELKGEAKVFKTCFKVIGMWGKPCFKYQNV